MAEKFNLEELGSTGLRRTGGTVYEEFLTVLRGVRGARVYREMADNDPTIGSMLFAIEKVITRLEWRVDPYSDNSADGEVNPEDKETAEFVESCLHDMSDSWDSTLSQILSMLIFGYSYHEIVYKKRGGDTRDNKTKSKFDDGKIGWRKMPIRAQETYYQWMFDEEGGIQGFQQVDPATGGFHEIPIEKALLFRTSSQKNNPEGRSILRNAYRPYYFKRRIEEIEAIGIERDLAGLPVAFVPPEYLSSAATAEQASVLASIQQIVTSIKRNEQEGIVMPAIYDDAGHKLFDLQLMSSGGSRQFDTDKIIQRYDQRMAMSILSDFILLGSDRVGSYALGTSKMDLWSMSVDSIAKNIAEVINQYAIPRLLKLNGMDSTRAPFLTYGEVSHVDLTEIADFVSKLAGAGVLMPDPNLEDYLRELSGLPPAEHDGANFGMPPMPGAQTEEEPEEEEEEETSTLDELESPEGAEPLDGDTD
jgi:phage gp29-like protein